MSVSPMRIRTFTYARLHPAHKQAQSTNQLVWELGETKMSASSSCMPCLDLTQPRTHTRRSTTCSQFVWNLGEIVMKESSGCTCHVHLSTATLKHFGAEQTDEDWPLTAGHVLSVPHARTQTCDVSFQDVFEKGSVMETGFGPQGMSSVPHARTQTCDVSCRDIIAQGQGVVR